MNKIIIDKKTEEEIQRFKNLVKCKEMIEEHLAIMEKIIVTDLMANVENYDEEIFLIDESSNLVCPIKYRKIII